MTIIIPILLISYALGQLTRIELAPGIQVYFQDFLILIICLNTATDLFRKRNFKHYLLAKPILTFTIASLISLLFSLRLFPLSQVLVGGLYWLRWVAYSSLYFFLVGSSGQPKGIRLFSRKYSFTEALMITGFSMAFFGLLQYLFLPDTRSLALLGWDDHYYRLIGTLLDPGFMGLILTLTIFTALATKVKVIFKALLVSLPVAALLLTYSRSSYLAFLVGFTVLALKNSRLKKAIIAIALFLPVIFFLPKYQSEGTNLLRTYSLFDRIETWQESLAIFKTSPVFGIGFNNLRFAKLQLGLAGEEWQTSHSLAGVENSYLFVLSTTGTLGFSALIWLLASALKLGLPLNRENPQALFLASYAAILVHAFFNNSLFYPWVMVWFWILLAELETATPRKKLQSQ